MKARIIRDDYGYHAEVYGTMNITFLGYEISEKTGWHKVTGDCFTEYGAKRELKKWKQKNMPDEFEI